MGSIDSVPSAFRLTVVDGRERLSFAAASISSSAGASNSEDPVETGVRGAPNWIEIQALELESPVRGSGTPAPPDERKSDSDASTIREQFQNRRLVLRAATLLTSIRRVQEALAVCPFAEEGIVDPRIWMGPSGPRLVGRFAFANQVAPFTIRVGIETHNEGRRRVHLDFADVRLYAPLAVPAPLVGLAVARALGSAADRGGVDVQVRGAGIALDPLELALVFSLVTQGWRLPDLNRAWLQSLVHADDSIRLRFNTEGHPTEPLPTLEPSSTGPGPGLSTIEGGRLPDALAEAEQRLFASDLSGAEWRYRDILARNPAERSALTRLVALRAAAHGDDVHALADQLMNAWPEHLPGFLYAATEALAVGHTTRATEFFHRVASLADERGEIEDAALARLAARTASGSEPSIAPPAVPLMPPPTATDPTTDDQTDSTVAPPEADHGIPTAVPSVESGNITAKTMAVYAERENPDELAQVLGGLLHAFERLTPERQHDAYASFARVAEATGDLEHAEEAYWRATSIATDETRRADDLTAHARVLLSRGNRAAAVTELHEALGLVPDHAHALTLLADQAFQAKEWERARDLYARLDQSPEAGDAIARDLLVLRRGALARTLGDLNAAEDFYRQMIGLDPRHVEARHALANIALERHDLPSAAKRMEDLLNVLPSDAIAELTDVRKALGDVHYELGNWDSAQHYLELALAHDPEPLPILEHLSGVYEQLRLFPALVDTLERMARFYPQPRQRAQILLRQGDVLRGEMGDDARAFDVYLKSSDLDPTLPATALRLLAGFWERGQFHDAVAVADDLLRGGPLPDMEAPLRIRLAVALALGQGDAARAADLAELERAPWSEEAAVSVLAEAGAHLAEQPADGMRPAIEVMELWRTRGIPTDADGGP